MATYAVMEILSSLDLQDYGSESLPAGVGYNEEVYRSPSEDSGLGMGISDRNPRNTVAEMKRMQQMEETGDIQALQIRGQEVQLPYINRISEIR
nr:unnamed protein product [Callosobruchus chinensis]